jgi:hypothetical protein
MTLTPIHITRLTAALQASKEQSEALTRHNRRQRILSLLQAQQQRIRQSLEDL